MVSKRNHDLDAARGLVFGLMVAVALWVVVAGVLALVLAVAR